MRWPSLTSMCAHCSKGCTSLTCARWHVNDQDINAAPGSLLDEGVQGAHDHGASPHCCLILLQEPAWLS